MDRTRLACSNVKKFVGSPSCYPSITAAGDILEQMGTVSFHTPIQQSSAAFRCSSSMKNEHTRVAAANKLNVPRRLLLQFAVFSPVSLKVSPVLAAPTPQTNQPEVIRTKKFASGVRIQDIVDGEGVEAKEGNFVEVNYVCRRANGYFVHSTVDQFSGESSPVILPLDEKQIIKGLKEVLVGMKVGGKRRALIPPSVGYTTENLMPIPDEFGPRRSLLSHANEPLIFEVQLLKVLRSS